MYRFHIADDHPMLREALTHTITSHYGSDCVVEQSSELEETISVIGKNSDIDLLLLDINMPGNHDLYHLALIRNQFPYVPVVMVSAVEDIAIISRCMMLGSFGFIPKTANSQLFIEAINAILEGNVWLPEAIEKQLQKVVPESKQLSSIKKMATLTPQQYKVLCGLREGYLNKQIAYKLNITEATVKAHVSAIFRKLEVTNRTQAILLID